MSARGIYWIFPAVRFLCVLSALFPCLPPADAQADRSTTKSFSDDFRQTVRKSGLVFDGTVTAIERDTGTGNIPQTYRISFRVNQGLRGVRTGATLTIREWAGLWVSEPGAGGPTHRPRYRLGERAVLFLYPASRTGLTSPVGGMKGKLAVTLAEEAILPADWNGSWVDDRAKGTIPAQGNKVPLWQLVQRVQRAGED